MARQACAYRVLNRGIAVAWLSGHDTRDPFGSGSRLSMRPILHATDFSAASRPAFDVAVDLARHSHAPLLLLHVLNPMLPEVADVSPPTYEGLRASLRRWAEARMHRLVQRAQEAGVRVMTMIAEGKEADAIARVARGHHASQIVMGTHGRSGLTRLFLGSVASRVLAIGPCPVLTVRSRGRASTDGRPRAGRRARRPRGAARS
jgi:nucleotide-binding universal stress UspA family protein